MAPAMGQGCGCCLGSSGRATQGPGPAACERVTGLYPSVAAAHAWRSPAAACRSVGRAGSGSSAPGQYKAGDARPYCRLRQQMATAAAALLPGTLAATQVSSTA